MADFIELAVSATVALVNSVRGHIKNMDLREEISEVQASTEELSTLLSKVAGAPAAAEDFKPSLERISEKLKEIDGVLAQCAAYQDKGKMKKFWSSGKNKELVEKANARLTSATHTLRILLETVATTTQIEHFNVKNLIKKPEARKFWIKKWGSDTQDVKWSSFYFALQKEFSLDENKVRELILKQFMDYTDDGFVEALELEAFCIKFGDLPEGIHEAEKIGRMQAFHWSVPRAVVEEAVRAAPNGSYVVRISSLQDRFATTLKPANWKEGGTLPNVLLHPMWDEENMSRPVFKGYSMDKKTMYPHLQDFFTEYAHPKGFDKPLDRKKTQLLAENLLKIAADADQDEEDLGKPAQKAYVFI